MAGVAVLLDLDGTLIDSRRDLATAVNLMRRDLGLEALPVEVVAGNVGDGLGLLVERSLADAPAGPALARAVELTRRHYLEHLRDETVLYPGVLAALRTMREKGYATAVVTNKPDEPARLVCDGLGLSSVVDVVLGAAVGRELKPKPGALLEALRLTGSRASGSWMVGDNHTDLAAGRNAGLRRCFCRYGFGDPAAEGWELAIDALAELAEALERSA